MRYWDTEFPEDEVQAWIDALRSGEYKQDIQMLQSSENYYCCLGVACKVLIPKEKLILRDGKVYGRHLQAQDYHPNWLGVLDAYADFAQLNDVENLTFEEIADLVQGLIIEGGAEGLQ